MHVIKNERGNVVFYQNANLRSCWGFVDDKGDYITDRDVKKGQIFYHFKNAIAIQLEILEYMEKIEEKNKGRSIRIRIENFEKENFWAVCKVKDFRILAVEEFGNKAIFNYDKKDYKKYGYQIRLPLNSFVREYDSDKKLGYFLRGAK